MSDDSAQPADGGRTVATNRTTRDATIGDDGDESGNDDNRVRTIATNRTTRDATIGDDEPRWQFEWSNIRDGAGVFVR